MNFDNAKIIGQLRLIEKEIHIASDENNTERLNQYKCLIDGMTLLLNHIIEPDQEVNYLIEAVNNLMNRVFIKNKDNLLNNHVELIIPDSPLAKISIKTTEK